MTEARYVFAIGRALDSAALAGLRGIDGAQVHLVPHRDLVAVVSTTPLDEAALTARLERLDQLAAVAEVHHAVVAAVAALTVVAPFRLATIYRDEHRVRALLRDRYETFRALLDRLAGKVEVGVKLYAEDPSPVPAVLLRRGRQRGAVMTGAIAGRNIALVDVLDRLLEGGVVLTGDLTLAIADVDLVRISLRALICPVEAARDAVEIGGLP